MANNSQLQWIVFQAVMQTSFKEFKKTVLPEWLEQAAFTSIASPMKDLKIKGGSFDMAEQQVVQVL
jgi:hypothetical protein